MDPGLSAAPAVPVAEVVSARGLREQQETSGLLSAYVRSSCELTSLARF